MQDIDVLVIGAGIAGASLAYRLSGRRRVVIVEREERPGYHATGRSAAMFMERYGPPGVRALTRASRGFYTRAPTDVVAAPLLAPRGVLYVATPQQAGRLDAERLAPQGPLSGLPRIEAGEALALVPCLRVEALAGALLDDEALDLDVHALHDGLLRAARRAGVELRTSTEPLAARHDGRRWQVDLGPAGTVAATWVVDAAGAWADEVAVRFGAAPLGLQPRRRSAFTFDAPPGANPRPWPSVVALDESYYFKPDAGRLLGSPANADDVAPHDVVPEELDIALGIHRIEAATTLTIRRPASTWAGLRTFARDGELVIGPDDAVPGFFWLAGQGGYGIQSAAGASALAAARLCGDALPPELAAQGVEPALFDPRRLR